MENVALPDMVVAHVMIDQHYQFDDALNEAQERLMQEVRDDCKGRDREFNCVATWVTYNLPDKFTIVANRLKIVLRVLSPLYLLAWLIGMNCVFDVVWRLFGTTVRMQILKKVSSQQDLRNPPGMNADQTPV